MVAHNGKIEEWRAYEGVWSGGFLPFWSIR